MVSNSQVVPHTAGVEAGRLGVAPTVATPVLPGVLAALMMSGLAVVANLVVPQLSTLIIAVSFGIVLGNLREETTAIAELRPGLALVAKKFLRAGVVLLGLRLSLGQIAELGLPTVVLVVATVAATFFGTQALGRRLGLSRGLSLLVATGYSICGASAIAAMESSSDAEEEEVAVAIGLVTIAGSLAMFGLPILAQWFGLSDEQFGTWVGASVHDVAQVVAAASTGGAKVLAIAVVVKLTRVVLLAPIVAGVSVQRSRIADAPTGNRPPLLPGFVLGFLALVMVRTAGVLPSGVTDTVKLAEGFLLTTALVGLGAGVNISRLRSLGVQPLVLGGLAWILVATVSLGGVLVLG